MLTGPDRATALFTGNDNIALIVLKHLAVLGVRVPLEVSAVGFDNMHFTEHLAVPWTSRNPRWAAVPPKC